jgi:hypothetical protein
MAEESHITEWYVGEDKVFPFTIYQKTAAGVLTTTPQDITGWTLRWDLRRSDTAADPVVLTKATPTGVTIDPGTGGTGFVTVLDTDSDTLAPNAYRHALKRDDANFETILSYGNAILKKRAAR